jgi:hypothetical protein
MKSDNLVIWRSIDVLIKTKMYHQKRSALYKRNKRRGRGFCLDYGDIPACVIDGVTLKSQQVDNPRGVAYAYRNRLKYRKNKHESQNKKLSKYTKNELVRAGMLY